VDYCAKKGSLAGEAVRAHHESEAERIIVLIGNELGLPKSFAGLQLLKKSDPRKVICPGDGEGTDE